MASHRPLALLNTENIQCFPLYSYSCGFGLFFPPQDAGKGTSVSWPPSCSASDISCSLHYHVSGAGNPLVPLPVGHRVAQEGKYPAGTLPNPAWVPAADATRRWTAGHSDSQPASSELGCVGDAPEKSPVTGVTLKAGHRSPWPSPLPDIECVVMCQAQEKLLVSSQVWLISPGCL